MLRLVFTFFALLQVFYLAAQSHQPMLIGKWEYAKPMDEDKMDEKGKEMSQAFFGGMTLQFDESGDFKGMMMGKPGLGSWKMLDKETIELTADNEIMEVKILDFSDNEMAISFQRAKLIFKKVQAIDAIPDEEKDITLDPMKATLDQLAKYWQVTSMDIQKSREKKRTTRFNR